MLTLPTESEPVTVIEGDCLDVLRSLPDGCVDAVVTSPPYWGGVRIYGSDTNGIGTESGPLDYVESLSRVFAGVRRVMATDGFVWLNVGDAYAASGKGGGGSAGSRGSWDTVRERKGFRSPPAGYKNKDLTLVAFQLADRLRRDGWYLRQTVVWSKPSATEPKRLDRPSCSHEYAFLLAASEQYSARDPGRDWWGSSVWAIRPDASSEHPATMPLELARRCVATTTHGATVLDPFAGSGTTLLAAREEGMSAVGIEQDTGHCDIIRNRLAAGADNPNLFSDVA